MYQVACKTKNMPKLITMFLYAVKMQNINSFPIFIMTWNSIKAFQIIEF